MKRRAAGLEAGMHSIDHILAKVLMGTLCLTMLLGPSSLTGQSIPRDLLEQRTGNPGSTGPQSPSDLIAGPFPLSGSSAYGICYMPDNNPWAQPIVVVAELFSAESWVYDAQTLAPIGPILNPPAGISVTGVTTDGTWLYWGIINPPGPNEIWRSNPDGTDPVFVGNAALQGGGFIGGLSWDGADGIWAADITADQYDLISISDGSYLGSSVSHPDGNGLGNGLAFRADCNRLSIPHGHDLSGRVTTLSSVSIQSSIPLAPVDLSNHGFFINGVESSRPAVAPAADPFGLPTYWIIDNSSNTISVVEGHSPCPTLISPLADFSCTSWSDGTLHATWDSSTSADQIEIRVNGILVDTVPAFSGSWSGITSNLPSLLRIEAQGFSGNSWTPAVSCDLVVPGCDPATTELSHSVNPQTLTQGTPFCGDASGHQAQSLWRRLSPCDGPFLLGTGLILESVRVGIENSNPGIGFSEQPLVLRVYQDLDGGDIDAVGDMILLHEQTFAVPTFELSNYCLTLDSPVEIPCGMETVIEFHLPDGTSEGHLLILGSNNLGESDPTWFSAPFCGNDLPVRMTDLGFPEIHMSATFRGAVIDSPFRRGDVNGDDSVNLADAIFMLESLFVPGSAAVDCRDAADCNDDEGVNLADSIYLLSHLFVPGSPTLPEPEGDCGADPTSAGVLTCEFSVNCP
jgi:hypothetical protein